jgi:hypothetical protein
VRRIAACIASESKAPEIGNRNNPKQDKIQVYIYNAFEAFSIIYSYIYTQELGRLNSEIDLDKVMVQLIARQERVILRD